MARVNDIFGRAIRAAGLSTYAIGYVPSPLTQGQDARGRSPFLLLDWPKAWLELYAREGFAAEDITVMEAARQNDAFTWTEVQARYPGSSARVFAAAQEFGWGDGFVIPVHTPFAPADEQFGIVSLAAEHLEGFKAETKQAVTTLSLTAFAQARKLTYGSEQDRHAPILTERERQALALVAEGLSDPAIAAEMGVTRATAHFHVERAKKSLSAKTRAQAVAIALTQGLF